MLPLGRLALAALLSAAALGLTVPAATADSRPSAIVSLGDSFVSGEGGRWLGNGGESDGSRSGTDRAAYACGGWGCAYDPARIYGSSEDDDCHRSDVAPIESAPVAVDERVNLACSGARLVNLWPASRGGESHFGEPPQAERLAAIARRAEVRMVVVSAGANDIGFGELVAGCALDWARSDEEEPALCRDEAGAELRAALPVAERGLTKALRGVRAALGEAGQGPSEYRLVVMGYASPFPPARFFRYPESGWSRLHEGGCPVWDADADWAAGEAVGALAVAMRDAAASVGAEFLDLRHTLDGHQLCDRRAALVGPEGPSPLAAEWVRRLSFLQGSARESLHPNAYGQQAIGACLGLLYATAGGDYACRDTPGRFLGGMRLEPLPESPL
ncbi:MAG: GDSL-type esterase/lipase family protein [Solirubrobacterales bacterium]